MVDQDFNNQATIGKQPQSSRRGKLAIWTILSILLPILGLILYLIWEKKEPQKARWAGLGAIAGLILGIIIFFLLFNSLATLDMASDATNTATPIIENSVDEAANKNKQAVEQAEAYLASMAFSKKGLVNQLKYDNFTEEEAVFAVENIDVDWFDQAEKQAQAHLQHMPFSRDDIIYKLKHNGFTTEQAIHGADKVESN